MGVGGREVAYISETSKACPLYDSTISPYHRQAGSWSKSHSVGGEVIAGIKKVVQKA